LVGRNTVDHNVLKIDKQETKIANKRTSAYLKTEIISLEDFEEILIISQDKKCSGKDNIGVKLLNVAAFF
jgi:hypothetical protein